MALIHLQIILFVPSLYQSVKREGKLESDKFLADFSVLIRSLVLFHADKPELYKKSFPDVIGVSQILLLLKFF